MLPVSLECPFLIDTGIVWCLFTSLFSSYYYYSCLFLTLDSKFEHLYLVLCIIM